MKWNSEKILSISAILISIGTFVVFAYQTSLMRKEQHMSVYPHLQFTNYQNYSRYYKYVLTNKGVGPAIVTFSDVYINGKSKGQDLASYLRDIVIKRNDSIYFTSSNISKGLFIAEKESIELVLLSGENSYNNSVKLYEYIHNDSLEFIINYESIYGKKWKISNKIDLPIKIE
ncbi:MAG: hypothetical protein JEY97_14370 [Bacteroidales bacterium]|nr:hypothetical protein [Bacteroidales bacterium]